MNMNRGDRHQPWTWNSSGHTATVVSMARGPRPSLFFLFVLSAIFLAGCSFIPMAEGKRYALVYGVGDYNDDNAYNTKGLDLPGAAQDAMDLAKVLLDRGFDTLFSAAIIKVEGELDETGARLDKRASKKSIEADIEELAGVAKPGDMVFFSYSGHGELPAYEIREPHLILSLDSNSPPPWGEDDALTVSELTGLFALFHSEVQVVVVIDACYSGAFLPPDKSLVEGLPRSYSSSSLDYVGPKVPLNFASLFSAYQQSAPGRSSNVQFISAAGSLELSWEVHQRASLGEDGAEGTKPSGVLSYFFRRALTDSSSDANRDGLLTLDEVYNRVFQDIQNIWNANVGPKEMYLPHRSGGSMDVVLFAL